MKETLEGLSMEIPMKCKVKSCDCCPIHNHDGPTGCVQRLASEIQRLRDEREKVVNVWKDAPGWADTADVDYQKYGDSRCGHKTYTRELPKTIKQEIAEEFATAWMDNPKASSKDSLVDAFVEALKELEERTK